MKTSEFQTLKTIIQESQSIRTDNHSGDIEDFLIGDLEERLMDGANIIDLYSDFNSYPATNPEQEERFWNKLENCLVDERDIPRGLDEEN